MEKTYPIVLVYRTPDLILNRLTPLLRNHGISVRVVRKEQYTVPLNVLLGIKQPGRALPGLGIELAEPMLIMHGFSSELVDVVLKLLRENSIRIDLKAVTTPTNLAWTSLQVYAELRKERETFLNQNK
ncbi:MAG: DUF3783 domain-containing protein [Eubacteriales bacterium]|nr:DUF3783 domain-containing protein [Eubacteriales bacterium]